MALEGLVIVALLLALVWGQPAALTSAVASQQAQATLVTDLRATVAAYPRPTVLPCFYGTRIDACRP